MKKLLILGCFKGNWQIIDYARRNGIYTIVTDRYSPEESFSKKWADSYWMIDTADIDALEQKCREERIDGVMCGLTEFNITKMIELTSRLNLPCYLTKEQWHYSKDKADFKKLCEDIGVNVAEGYDIRDDYTEDDIKRIKYPVVVKPVDRAGNYGISFVDSKDEFKEAYELAKSVTYVDDKIIVERMLHGEQYYAVYAVRNDEIKLLGQTQMFNQDGTPSNCYVVTTTAASNVKRYIEEFDPQVRKIIREIGITDGIFWIQTMLDEDGKFYAIEIGQRIDGEMMYIPFKWLSEYDAIGWLVDTAVGNKHKSFFRVKEQTEAFEACTCGFLLWSDRDATISRIEGMDTVAQWPGFYAETMKVAGDKLDKYESFGTISFTAPNVELMNDAIKKINETVHVYDESGNDIVVKYDSFDKIVDAYNRGRRDYE